MTCSMDNRNDCDCVNQMQLKAYIQEPNTNLKLESSYRAVAVNKETLEGLLTTRTENMPTELVHIFGVCPFIALGLIFLIAIIILILYACAGKMEKKPKLNRQRKSVILSITLISCSRLVYFIFLDGFALHVRNSTLLSDLKESFMLENPVDIIIFSIMSQKYF